MQNEFDYKKYLHLLLRHKLLFAIAALSIMSGAIVICYLMPNKYEAQSTVFIEKNVLNDLVKDIAVTPSVEDTLRGLNSNIKSSTILSKVIKDIGPKSMQMSDKHLDEAILALQRKTDVNLDEKDGLITVSFTDSNPSFAMNYVNDLVRCFIEGNLSSKKEASYGATSFISKQIASYKEKIDKADAEINKFRREKGALLSAEPVSFQTEIGAGQQRLDDLILRRSQLETTRNQLKRNNPARARLNALQKRLEELRVDYTDNYPEVQKVKADIEVAQSESSAVSSSTVSDTPELERVDNELRAVRISEANQRALLANSRGLLREGPSAKATLDKMTEERNKYVNFYDHLVASGGQAEVLKQMDLQGKSPTFRIVEPAVMPVKPIGPNRVKLMLLGIIAGFAGGLALLLLIDYFDKTVKTVDALKVLGVQVLAVIPKISDPHALEKERLRDRRLYIASGAYFSVIVLLLALEKLNLSPLEKIIGLISG